MPGGAGLNLGVRIAFDAESADSVICSIFAGGLKMSAADVGTGILCCMANTIICVRVEHDEICSCCCDKQLWIPNAKHFWRARVKHNAIPQQSLGSCLNPLILECFEQT